MRLQVVGEHLARIRRIDEDHFDAVAGQNWYHVIGLRNIISHGYETIDMEQIWKIISTEISLLDASLDILGGD